MAMGRYFFQAQYEKLVRQGSYGSYWQSFSLP